MDCIKNKKLGIYPYNPDFATVLRRSDIISTSNGVFAITPIGLGIEGKDSDEIDGGSHIGIDIVNDFDSCLDEVDSMLFLDYKNVKNEVFNNLLYKCVHNNKDIILFRNIDEEVDKEIQLLSDQNSTQYVKRQSSQVESMPDNFTKEIAAHKIDVPVIIIIGLSEYTNKFDVGLMLYNEISNIGYKVSYIGSRSYCEFLGFHSFPEFMTNDVLSGEKKVLMFSHYIKSIESKEKPDVILLTIPGGVLPLNNKINNGFGMLAYEVSQAVKPDITILCTPYENHRAEFFPELFQMLKYRFDFEPDFINIANLKILWGDTRFRENISYLRIDSKKVDEVVNKLNESMEIPFFNSLNEHSSKQIANCIINKLQNNLAVV